MSTTQKIAEIEAEMERTQKNKATSYHLGLLKAKLAKLKREIIEPAGGKKGGTAGEGFEVSKSGDARVGMIGFPSVGKSTLLTKLTGANHLMQEPSRRSQLTNSRHWLAFRVFWDIRGLRSSCWICRVSSRVPRTARVEVNKSLLWHVPATSLLSCLMPPVPWATKRSLSTS